MSNSDRVKYIAYHQSFDRITGKAPSATLLCESPQGLALFHEACIYHEATKSVFVTSTQLKNDDNDAYEATSHKHVKLFRIYDDPNETTNTSAQAPYEEITFPGSHFTMLNGGVNFNASSILLCAQGSKSCSNLSCIISLAIPTANDPKPTPQPIITSFHGIPFNSVNDVIAHPQDSSIWFTDPSYGHHQGIRPPPQLPDQVYRYDPTTSPPSIRAMADGFTRPNGLCFSPDLKTLYVTDTGAIQGSSTVTFDSAGRSHIYAFDVVSPTSGGGGPMLTNRRLFAYAPGRVPDGIKCDTRGNVYSGCMDGIEVWNPEGVLLGVIAIEGGVANFCFGEGGVVYACNETRFWRVTLEGEGIRGALLGI